MTYPPFAAEAGGGVITGIEAATVKALSDEIGYPVHVVSVPFTDFIPALKSGRVDIGMTDVADTAARRASADFIDYLKVGNTVLGLASGNVDVAATKDLCGLAVAVQSGESVVAAVQQEASKCSQLGKKALQLHLYGSQNDAVLAVTSGRAQVMVGAAPSNAYIATHSDGKLKVVSPILNPPKQADAGWAFPKGSVILKPVLAGMQKLYRNGTLRRIYAQYGLSGILAYPGENVSEQSSAAG